VLLDTAEREQLGAIVPLKLREIVTDSDGEGGSPETHGSAHGKMISNISPETA
jgi:hypothetical protein